MRKIVSWVLVSGVLSGVIAFSRAQAAPPPPGRETPESRQYSALLNEAVSEYDARRYEESRALFQRAHEMSPNARTLRGLGMASFELRDYVDALRALEASLVHKRRPLTATQRQQVQSLVDRSRAFVGRFLVRVSAADYVLRVDGAAASLEPDGTLLLSFGRHQMSAEAPGKIAENREISVIGGERQDLAFDLRPIPAPVAAPLTPPPRESVIPAAPRDDARSDTGQRSRAGWWFAGAGLLAGGAIGSFFWWRFQNDQLATCDHAVAVGGVCGNRSVLIFRERAAIGAIIGGAAGALALGTIGAVVWAKKGKAESGLALACGPGLGAVNCELKLTF